jgi:putative (di)nucleoside polyphosphate hydrolase
MSSLPDTAAPLSYRPCVGIALFNAEGRVFVAERIDRPGAWQMPQGGIDPGEDIRTAALRELREEIGTDRADILGQMDRPLRYDVPAEIRESLFRQGKWNSRYVGQEQTWVAARFRGRDSDIDLAAFDPPEFQRWQWVALDDIIRLIVPFKRDVYGILVESFRPYAVASGEPPS